MTDRQTVGARAHRAFVNTSSLLAAHLIQLLPERVQVVGGGGRITVDGNTLDPAVQMLLAGQHAAHLVTMGVIGDPGATRTRSSDVCALFAGAEVVVDTDDVTLDGPAGPIRARHYQAAAQDAPVLVFFHGGGYVFGDLDTHDSLCRRLCRDAGLHVLAVDYRLAPEHKAPAAVDDAYAAYLWAQARFDRVAVGGDSAGGGLAATICRLARDAGEPAPILQLLLYPYLAIDIPTRSRSLFAEGFLLTEADQIWFASQYIDGSSVPPDDPRVSPLLADDASGLPPALIVTAGFDPLRDQGRAYVEKLRAAGGQADLLELGSMMHAFANFMALGGGVEDAVTEITDALRVRVASPVR